jgi:hypothetical protein
MHRFVAIVTSEIESILMLPVMIKGIIGWKTGFAAGQAENRFGWETSCH